MQRGAPLLATLSRPGAAVFVLFLAFAGLLAAACVDLGLPPELIDPVGVADADPAPPDPPDGPENPQPAGAEDAGAAPDVPVPEDAAAPDAPGPDLPAADATGPEGPPAPDVSPEAVLPADAGPARDAGPDAPTVLVIDNFADGNVASNSIGGQVVADNQILGLAAGELSFVWNGNSVFHKFSETLGPRSCPVDIRGYRTLRFRMRSSMPGQVIQLFMGRASPGCVTTTVTGIDSITLSTTMTTYTIDLAARERGDASFFEWSPPLDSAVYFLDDIELHP